MNEVRIYGDPVLRQKALPVEKFDDALRQLAEEMLEDMEREEGVGLAAPQVGHSIKLIVTDHTSGKEDPRVFVNPEITWSSEETSDYDEGCLSVPDITAPVTRPVSISISAQDLDGTPFVMDKIEGFLARVIQHEVDHLNGILFVDRLSMTRRALINGKLKKMGKDFKCRG